MFEISNKLQYRLIRKTQYCAVNQMINPANFPQTINFLTHLYTKARIATQHNTFIII